jgi:hypothetical protein
VLDIFRTMNTADTELPEQFTLRRKFFKLFGAAFHIYDTQDRVVAYCKQKAFKLREDIRLYTSEDMTEEFMRIGTGSIIDFSASYSVTTASGQSLGSLRRRGFKSIFRDEWLVFSASGVQIGVLKEESGVLALLRRLHEIMSLIAPQTFVMLDQNGQLMARFRQHRNPFIYRLGIAIAPSRGPDFDERFIIAGASLIGAIEGRQS